MIPDPNPTLDTTWPLHPAGSIILTRVSKLWPTQLGLGFLETLETLETLVRIIARRLEKKRKN